MKKLMIVAIVFAIALSANVAFATECGSCGQEQCACTDQSNSASKIDQSNASVASTGGNGITNNGRKSINTITAGEASSTTYGINAVNGNIKTGMRTKGAQKNDAYKVTQMNSSYAEAGLNGITNTKGCDSINTVTTKKATSYTKGINLVNTNVKIGCPCVGQPTCGCATK